MYYLAAAAIVLAVNLMPAFGPPSWAVPLAPLTLAFFAGRVVSYSVYVSTVAVAQHSYGAVMTSALRSPWGITLQVALLLGLVALARIDVAAIARRSGAGRVRSG